MQKEAKKDNLVNEIIDNLIDQKGEGQYKKRAFCTQK